MAGGFRVVLLGLATLAAFGAVRTGEATLQVASVVFRHGHRNIMRTYDFDPYSNASYWPGGIGQITNRGKMQMYQFGQLLRERYGSLLSDQYTPDETLVRTSSTPRCVSSALCVLAGLFPPVGPEVWNPSLLWQPVPVVAPAVGTDKLIKMDASCPAYEQEFERQMNAPEIAEFNRNYSDVYGVIGEHWEPVYDFVAPNNLHDHFTIEVDRGFPLPEWTRDIYPDKLLEISNQYHLFRTFSPLLTRLRTGPIMKDIVTHMMSKQNHTAGDDTKMLLYSGHDDTITGLLSALGFPNRFKVQYGAAMFLELHKNAAGTYQVKVFFMKNVDRRVIERMQLAGCDPDCSLDAFVDLVTPILPRDWDKECQLDNTDAI